MRALSRSTYTLIWHKSNVQRRGLMTLWNTCAQGEKDHFSCHLCIHVGGGRVTGGIIGSEEDGSLLLHCLRSVPIDAIGRPLLLKQYHTSVNGVLAKSHLFSPFTLREGRRSGKTPRWRHWVRPEWLTHMRTQLNPLPKHQILLPSETTHCNTSSIWVNWISRNAKQEE